MTDAEEQAIFNNAISGLHTELVMAGSFLVVDAEARSLYTRKISEMAAELRRDVIAGRLSWKQAAETANETRNVIMNVLRGRSSPVGRAIAESLKLRGRSLNALVANKSQDLFGPRADFSRLAAVDQKRSTSLL